MPRCSLFPHYPLVPFSFSNLLNYSRNFDAYECGQEIWWSCRSFGGNRSQRNDADTQFFSLPKGVFLVLSYGRNSGPRRTFGGILIQNAEKEEDVIFVYGLTKKVAIATTGDYCAPQYQNEVCRT